MILNSRQTRKITRMLIIQVSLYLTFFINYTSPTYDPNAQ